MALVGYGTAFLNFSSDRTEQLHAALIDASIQSLHSQNGVCRSDGGKYGKGKEGKKTDGDHGFDQSKTFRGPPKPTFMKHSFFSHKTFLKNDSSLC
jgi:hypothetical protein